MNNGLHDRRDAIRNDRAAKRRQDPVSCRLCRTKKLKCSRSNPCSNCIARNTSCEYDNNPTHIGARIQHDSEPTNSELMSRLQRLEDMIRAIGHHGPSTPETTNSHPHENSAPVSQPFTPSDEDLRGAEDLVAFKSTEPSALPNIADTFVFEAVSRDDFVRLCGVIDRQMISNGRRTIIVPQLEDAREIIHQYEQHVASLHHIIHIQTLKRNLESFYESLKSGGQVNTDHAALLLTVFGTVQCYTGQNAISNDSIRKDKIFLVFFRAALDLVDYSRRILPPAMEIVQSCMILVFLDYNVEGFTTRPRLVLSQAITLAKELGMHKLDSTIEVRKRELNPPDLDGLINLEIQRRIWWHLTATDWMLSSTNTDTYSIAPHQIRVRLPRNINDSLLDSGNVTADLPLNQPSAMSYPLQRVRLAELFRTVCDYAQTSGSDSHQEVLSLDLRITNFIDDLPVFLRIDSESIEKSTFILKEYPYFALHRYIINVGAQGLRCRLHQTLMRRHDGNQTFKASAELGLAAAMQVLKINKVMKQSESKTGPSCMNAGMIHYTFLATIVIVKDLCFNRSEGGGLISNPELSTALEMLADVKDHSASSQRFLDTMMDVLRRHQVRPDHDQKSVSRHQANPLQWQPRREDSTSEASMYQPSSSNQVGGQTGEHYAYSSWQNALDQSAYADMPDWDQLFSELDTFIA